MKTHYLARELAGLPGMPTTERRVRDMADRESWSSQERQGRGGGREYPLWILPPQAQAALVRREWDAEGLPVEVLDRLAPAARTAVARLMVATGAGDNPPADALIPATAARPAHPAAPTDRHAIREDGMSRYHKAKAVNRSKADERLEILEMFELYRSDPARDGMSLKVCMAEFCQSRPLGRDISVRTLLRWRVAMRDQGVGGVVTRYGWNEGRTLLTEEQKRFVIAMLVEYPSVRQVAIHAGLEARFGVDAVPHRSTTARFRERWIKHNQSLWLYLNNPDAWRNRHMAAFGSASEAVSTLNGRWEMDSTPADVILGDGKRHAVIGVIDVWSRRLMLLISRTSRATAITALMRRAILVWGVPTAIRTDNGQDYVARHTVRVLQGLEITQELCQPFTPEQKPHIERVFRTFAHGLVELLPGFVGHNVAEREAIRARQSFADRLLQRPGADGERKAVPLGMTAEELQALCDRWCEEIYQHGAHRGEGMHGKTPFQRAAEWREPIRRVQDERALDLLLSPAVDGEQRVVSKKGLRVEGQTFTAPELGPLVGSTVLVLRDEADLGRVYCFDGDHAFVCVAEDLAWQGVSRAEHAAAAKALQKRVMTGGLKKLRQTVKEAGVEEIHAEILSRRSEQVSALAALPASAASHTTPALRAAGQAARATTTASQGLQWTEAEREHQKDFLARLEEKRRQDAARKVQEEAPRERYGRYLALLERSKTAEELTQAELDFLELYPSGSEYKTQKRMAEIDHRAVNAAVAVNL